MKIFIASVIAVGLILMLGADEAAGTHFLACMKVKDDVAQARYSGGQIIGPLVSSAGCLVKVGATKICYSAGAFDLSPPPPGGGGFTPVPALAYLCYRVRCDTASVVPTQLKDEFGTHNPAVRPRIRDLCVPTSPSGAFLDASDTF